MVYIIDALVDGEIGPEIMAVLSEHINFLSIAMEKYLTDEKIFK